MLLIFWYRHTERIGVFPAQDLREAGEHRRSSESIHVSLTSIESHICCQNLLSKSEANSVVEASACKALDSLGPGGAQFRCRGYDVVPIAPRRPKGGWVRPTRSLRPRPPLQPWGLASFVGSWPYRSLWSTSNGDRWGWSFGQWGVKGFDPWEALACFFSWGFPEAQRRCLGKAQGTLLLVSLLEESLLIFV